MSSSEKLCLQWNDFKENILLSFQAQRDDRDFRDVTLAYEDGQHIEVYYIIFRQKCLIGLYFKLSLYIPSNDTAGYKLIIRLASFLTINTFHDISQLSFILTHLFKSRLDIYKSYLDHKGSVIGLVGIYGELSR